MTNPTSAEYQLAVARFAQLSTDRYEHVRKDEAKRLGVRVSQLDEDVKRARLALTVPETADAIVKEFNRRFLVVNEAGRVLVYAPRQDSMLRRTVYERLGFEDFKKLYMNREVLGPNGLTDAADAWLRSPDRREYRDGVEFNPSGTPSPEGVFNLWQGWAVEPKLEGSWELLKKHIREVICQENRARFDYFIGWEARAVQQPATPGEVAIVLKGKKGTGKGIVARALRRIMGQHGLAVSQSKHLVGPFNLHLRDCIFLFADEAFFAGDPRHVGVLNALITEPTLTIEGKGANTFEARNFLHIMMASNERWVVPASTDERRYAMYEVGDQHIQDRSYFRAIQEELDADGHEAMLFDLLRYDLSSFDVGAVPDTAALQEQKRLSLPTDKQWWLDVLQRGYVCKSELGLDEYFGQWHDVVTTELLYSSYLAFAKNGTNGARSTARRSGRSCWR
jgi:Family of unknown function (DUF5906)